LHRPVKLAFHGAARTVTGSKHLLTVGESRILLDAGLFQGLKKFRRKNWEKPGFDPKSIDHVLLSHTHIDHVGFLPRLVKQGLKAPVHLTPAAFELAELMLLDSAKIQEEDARWANKRGYSRHKPALPLYGIDDAKKALELRKVERYGRWMKLDEHGSIRARFLNSGHLLGSAFTQVDIAAAGRQIKVVYSGDIGRFKKPLHLDPRPLPACDVLIIESTYGNRTHTNESVAEQVLPSLRDCLGRGGTVLIPAFAVGRSQQVTLFLRRLMEEKQIPQVPIHIDSPMAINATRIYSRFLDRRNIDADVFEDGRLRIFPRHVEFHRSAKQSRQLNHMKGPRIIVSASGMLSGGRVLHHLARLAPDRNNLVFLVGYQAAGTRGRRLLDGEDSIKIHGQHVKIRCKVVPVSGMSGHADRDELLSWVASAPKPPSLAFMVHGESPAMESLAEALQDRFGIRPFIPDLGDEYDLVRLLGQG
jgi:metallo-beta-lactamase family protein